MLTSSVPNSPNGKLLRSSGTDRTKRSAAVSQMTNPTERRPVIGPADGGRRGVLVAEDRNTSKTAERQLAASSNRGAHGLGRLTFVFSSSTSWPGVRPGIRPRCSLVQAVRGCWTPWPPRHPAPLSPLPARNNTHRALFQIQQPGLYNGPRLIPVSGIGRK